jgi:hypothetical protein
MAPITTATRTAAIRAGSGARHQNPDPQRAGRRGVVHRGGRARIFTHRPKPAKTGHAGTRVLLLLADASTSPGAVPPGSPSPEALGLPGLVHPRRHRKRQKPAKPARPVRARMGRQAPSRPTAKSGHFRPSHRSCTVESDPGRLALSSLRVRRQKPAKTGHWVGRCPIQRLVRDREGESLPVLPARMGAPAEPRRSAGGTYPGAAKTGHCPPCPSVTSVSRESGRPNRQSESPNRKSLAEGAGGQAAD